MNGDPTAGLDACVEKGMLRLDGREIRFRHELARRAIESSLSPARARSLHQHAVEILKADPGARASEIAHHAERASDAPTASVSPPRLPNTMYRPSWRVWTPEPGARRLQPLASAASWQTAKDRGRKIGGTFLKIGGAIPMRANARRGITGALWLRK